MPNLRHTECSHDHVRIEQRLFYGATTATGGVLALEHWRPRKTGSTGAPERPAATESYEAPRRPGPAKHQALADVLTDRGLEEHYGRRFGGRARALLGTALLLGWVVAALFAPFSTLLVSLVIAFLGGSILLGVFKEEIPSNRRSSFGWFTIGLTDYALLLAITTYVAG